MAEDDSSPNFNSGSRHSYSGSSSGLNIDVESELLVPLSLLALLLAQEPYRHNS